MPVVRAYRLRSDSGANIKLDRGLTTVGRSPDSHVVTDSSASRRHAIIEREGEAH